MWGEAESMEQKKKELNRFLVEVFAEVLKTEERCLENYKDHNLSLTEMHIIEAVCNAEEQNTDNRATGIAARLRVTAGTLTTAVALLEKKGYLIRTRSETDKRVVFINSTEAGKQAHRHHMKFHEEMVESVMGTLTKNETDVLVKALSSVAKFFDQKAQQK